MGVGVEGIRYGSWDGRVATRREAGVERDYSHVLNLQSCRLACDNEKNQDNTIIQPIPKSSYNLHVYFIESIYTQINNSFSNEMAIIVHFIMIYVMLDLRLFG